MAVCLGFMLLLMWALMRGGGGFPCTAGHGTVRDNGNADLRREIGELGDEIRRLQGASHKGS